MLEWVIVDGEYLNYLRDNYDSRVPKTDYGETHCKPFFGVLFTIGDIAYVAAVSHPQQKHDRMKSSPYFIKIFDGKDLICVVNLRYMFPVGKRYIEKLHYSKIDLLRSFRDSKERNSYIALLEKEIGLLRRYDIGTKAKQLYEKCTRYNNSNLAARCLSFSKLEDGCKRYYPNEQNSNVGHSAAYD